MVLLPQAWPAAGAGSRYIAAGGVGSHKLLALVAGQPLWHHALAAVVAADDTLIAVADLIPNGPKDMLSIIDGGPDLLNKIRDAAAAAKGGLPVAKAKLLAGVVAVLLAVVFNYGLGPDAATFAAHGRFPWPVAIGIGARAFSSA